jgi:hypothetical protein
MPVYLYCDVETAPADSFPGAPVPDRAIEAAEKANPPPKAPKCGSVPSNWKDQAKIDAKRAELELAHLAALEEHARDLAEHRAEIAKGAREWWGRESLDPIGKGKEGHGPGRIVSIGFAIGDGPVTVLRDDDEAAMLVALDAACAAAGVTHFVGHNSRGFDAYFIAGRAMVLDVAPRLVAWLLPVWLGRPSDDVIDTKDLLPVTAYNGRPEGTARLSDWCRALGISEPQPGMGDRVLDWWLAGDVDLIVQHNAADVVELRRLHQRILRYHDLRKKPAAEGHKEVA